MKRQLVFAYNRFIPARLRNAVPVSWRARVTRCLYRMTRHPDFAFRHIAQLSQMGRMDRAAALYADPSCKTAPHITMADPLFACTITGRSDVIQAEFGYRGLLVSVVVRSPPASIELRLDGKAVRKETLNANKAVARFSYLIGRDALDLFATNAELTVSAPDGAQIGAGITVSVPHGNGTLHDVLADRGLLEKKGGLRPSADTLLARQTAYLALYARVRDACHAEGRPLLILYGTLLGQHRSGDFIPGDDDFDVGYPTDQTTPAAVKADAIALMTALVRRGFTVSLNAEGKPFRISDAEAGPGVHLDNRPVFTTGDDHVWLHKHARLPLPMSDFFTPSNGVLREAPVLTPAHPEAFLAGYYGAGWKVPDPSFSNASKSPPAFLLKTLAQVCLTLSEQKALKAELDQLPGAGRFEPLALMPLYPVQPD